jgi:NarL family two-component system sensor histidine kinase YdfH
MKKPAAIFAFTKTENSELPFLYFLTVILTGVAIAVVVGSKTLQAPLHMVPFLILMALHIGLYWLSDYLPKDLHWWFTYLAIQGLLAFALNLLGQNVLLIFSLYLGLIGITAGMVSKTRWAIGFIGLFLGLSLANYIMQTGGWNQTIWWAISVLPMTAFVVIYVVLYNRQTEARAQAQTLLEELEAANRQLSDYSTQVADLTLANERQRMARELHDTLSQGLAGLILQLEAVDAHLESGRTERARGIVQQTMLQARETLADARRAIDDLRQPRDLAQSIRLEADHFRTATGIACQVEIQFSGAVPEDICEAIVRTAAEGLTNIARHANASQVEIHLSAEEGWLKLLIQDNGIGFDPEAAQQTASGHYGLLGMSERARMAQGELEIHSRPGTGTTIQLRLPMQNEQQAEWNSQ